MVWVQVLVCLIRRYLSLHLCCFPFSQFFCSFQFWNFNVEIWDNAALTWHCMQYVFVYTARGVCKGLHVNNIQECTWTSTAHVAHKLSALRANCTYSKQKIHCMKYTPCTQHTNAHIPRTYGVRGRDEHYSWPFPALICSQVLRAAPTRTPRSAFGPKRARASQAQGRAVRANKKTKKLADFSLLRLFMMLIIYFINIYIVYILKEVISHRSTFSLVFSWWVG